MPPSEAGSAEDPLFGTASLSDQELGDQQKGAEKTRNHFMGHQQPTSMCGHKRETRKEEAEVCFFTSQLSAGWGWLP